MLYAPNNKLNYLFIYFDINICIIIIFYYEFINLIFSLKLNNPTKNLKMKTTKIFYFGTFFYI